MRVKPRSSRIGVERDAEGGVIVRVHAAPVDNAANVEMLATLAEWLGLAKSRLQISSGATGRNKQIRVVDLTNDELLAILADR